MPNVSQFDYAISTKGTSRKTRSKRMSGTSLKTLRNSYLREGNLAMAGTVATAQTLLKQGNHSQAENILHSRGIDLTSADNRSTFPVEGTLTNRFYRVCHNLKGESSKLRPGDSLEWKKPAKPSAYKLASAVIPEIQKRDGCHYRGN